MRTQNTFKNDENVDIDVSEVLSLLRRRWKIIIYFLIGSILVSIPYSLTRQKVWEGRFQIVLDGGSKKTNINSTTTNRLGSLLGFDLGSSTSSLATEVIILESASVLKPIYNYAKNLKSIKTGTNQNLSFLHAMFFQIPSC